MTQTEVSQGVRAEIQAQAGKLLSQMAGYVGVRTIGVGLSSGLIEELSRRPEGLTSEALAANLELDPVYTDIWCRSAYAAEVLEATADLKYVLAPRVRTLLVDSEGPAYMGGLSRVLQCAEVFDAFSERLASGQRMWWDECSPGFIQAVSGAGRPFYTRLIPGGFSRVPGLAEKLDAGGAVLEIACGAGAGLERIAQTYPRCEFVGVDGDAYSLGVSKDRLEAAGLSERVSLRQSPLEELTFEREFDLAFINISMHECRDVHAVASNVRRALKPRGYFVISDFPFPEKLEDCRSMPGRVMSGIQFFESQIGARLVPTGVFTELLLHHGFGDVGSFEITPVHNVIHGRRR